ncbi:MAG: class I SAM-dependent methyltransferase [Gaiellaceae bacterium]
MEPTDHNRRAWDEVHRRRSVARAGEPSLPEPIRRSLGSLEGKRVIHLQCGTGESTIELAGLGAVATGVEVSAEALERACERGPAIVWVQADSQELPAELRRSRFDLVYTGNGALAAVGDLTGWATGIGAALRLGGDFLLYEEHPVAVCVDPMMRWRESYFDETIGGESFWRLGQVVTALARAGLTIRALEEYPTQKTEHRRQDARLPGEFLLHASRA